MKRAITSSRSLRPASSTMSPKFVRPDPRSPRRGRSAIPTWHKRRSARQPSPITSVPRSPASDLIAEAIVNNRDLLVASVEHRCGAGAISDPARKPVADCERGGRSDGTGDKSKRRQRSISGGPQRSEL